MAEPGAVIVIEDIDSATVTHQREKAEQSDQTKEKAGEAVTLSGLLNAVDGLASREDRVLIVTSNRADVLDTALLRPGRIDRREHIGLLEETEARAMCCGFTGGNAAELWDGTIKGQLPIAASRLQGILLDEIERERTA